MCITDKIRAMRMLPFLWLLIAFLPMVIMSCADEQFEDDKGYEDVDSFPMKMITVEALQGKWNSRDGSSQLLFSGNDFVSSGSGLGNLSGRFILTGNTIRVYNENDERIGYFPIVYFNQYIVIRYNSRSYSFFRDGDDPDEVVREENEGNNYDERNGEENDGNISSDDNPGPSIIESGTKPLDVTDLVGTWSVNKVTRDGESVSLDVNWINSRLYLGEDGTFSATYWLGQVDDSYPYSSYRPNFTPLSGKYSVDKNWNITLNPTNVNGTIFYKLLSIEKKSIVYQGDIYGNKNYKEVISSITYEVKKDGYTYVLTLYST